MCKLLTDNSISDEYSSLIFVNSSTLMAVLFPRKAKHVSKNMIICF